MSQTSVVQTEMLSAVIIKITQLPLTDHTHHEYVLVVVRVLDPDLASAKYKPELPPEVAITMDSLYVSDEIATRPW